MSYQDPQPPKKRNGFKTFGIIVASAVGAFVLIGVIAVSTSNPKPASPAVSAPETGLVSATGAAPHTPQTYAVAPPGTSAAQSGPLTTVSDGTYEVGVDMAAGKYKGQCTDGYWARLKDDSGSNIIDNDLKLGAALMQFTAKKGEYVEVSRCTFTKVG